jgi:hypothetical protein
MIIMDGVPVSDPFTGNFDATSIPSTDIAEIRIALTPASPLDGPGGDAGLIEVITYAATGPSRARAFAQASDSPGGVLSATVRTELGAGVYARASGGGSTGDHAFAVTLPSGSASSVREDSRNGNAALRFERRSETGGLSADLAFSRQKFFIPPGDDRGAQLQIVNRQDLFRGSLAGERRIGPLLLSARAYSVVLDRDGTSFSDATLASPVNETTFVHRTGGVAQGDYALSRELRLTSVTYLIVEGGRDRLSGGPTSAGASTVVEPAAGFFYTPVPWLAIDGAGGAAIPAGVPASPWPEAKLTTTLTATSAVQVKLTAVRKGRVPTVRERFAAGNGNPSLKPELGTSAEVTLLYKPVRWIAADVAPFYRRTEQFIRLNQTGAMQINSGTYDLYGLEARVEARPAPWAGIGAAYAFAHVQPQTGSQAGKGGTIGLDNLPEHRGEIWANLRYESIAGLWARVRYTGEMTDQGRQLGAYTTLDAAIFGRVDDVQITLRVENALDASYSMRLNVAGFGRTFFLGLEGTIQ